MSSLMGFGMVASAMLVSPAICFDLVGRHTRHRGTGFHVTWLLLELEKSGCQKR